MKRNASLMALALTAAVVQLFNCGFIEYKRTVREMTISPVPLERVRDGVYHGECDLNLVRAKVNVTVRDHFITAIQLEEHANGRGKAAETVIQDVLGRQKNAVDVVTGATASSKAILKAIENALSKGVRI